MSEETDNLITCSRCKELVPRKKFCCECAAPLAIVTQPSTTQPTGPASKAADSEPHPPVQVSDCVPSNIESTIGSNEEVSSNALNKAPPVVTTSSVPNSETNTSVVPSDGGQQGSTSTPSLYSVALSQSQSGHDTGVKHTQQSGMSPPPTSSHDNSTASHPSSSPTTGNGKSHPESTATSDDDKVIFECIIIDVVARDFWGRMRFLMSGCLTFLSAPIFIPNCPDVISFMNMRNDGHMMSVLEGLRELAFHHCCLQLLVAWGPLLQQFLGSLLLYWLRNIALLI